MNEATKKRLQQIRTQLTLWSKYRGIMFKPITKKLLTILDRDSAALGAGVEHMYHYMAKSGNAAPKMKCKPVYAAYQDEIARLRHPDTFGVVALKAKDDDRKSISVAGYALYGTCEDPDDDHELFFKGNRGVSSQMASTMNKYKKDKSLVELYILCSDAVDDKATVKGMGRALMMYSMWDTGRRIRKGAQRFNSMVLDHAEDGTGGGKGAKKLYEKFGFKNIDTVDGGGVKYKDGDGYVKYMFRPKDDGSWLPRASLLSLPGEVFNDNGEGVCPFGDKTRVKTLVSRGNTRCVH